MKIGLLGAGNIGQLLAKHDGGRRIAAVFDQNEKRAGRVQELTHAHLCTSADEFLDRGYEMMVEAASVEAVGQFCPAALERGRHCVILSVGALADDRLTERLRALAGAAGCRIHVPSGALFGLDNLKIARVSRLDRVVLRSTKKPASLKMQVDTKRCLFRGPASEGIQRFPRNVNIAVALSLAARREVDMELWVDPAATRNRHEVLIEGEFGDAQLVINNLPCPDNPATSYLAALSVMALLDGMEDPLVIGT